MPRPPPLVEDTSVGAPTPLARIRRTACVDDADAVGGVTLYGPRGWPLFSAPSTPFPPPSFSDDTAGSGRGGGGAPPHTFQSGCDSEKIDNANITSISGRSAW